MALIGTFKDSFSNATMGNGWEAYTVGSGAASISETGDHLAIAMRESTEGTNGSGYITVGTYDLTGSGVYLRLNTSAWVFATNQYIEFRVLFDTDDELRWLIYSAYIRAYSEVGGISTDEYGPNDYSATDHAWLRIREDGGTLYWDTADDNAGVPGTWTNRGSRATSEFTAGITTMKLRIYAFTGASVTPVGSAYFEAVNCAVASGDTGDTGAAVPVFAHHYRQQGIQ